MAYTSFTLRDYGGELSRVGVSVVEPAGAITVTTLLGIISDLKAAIEGVSLGVVAQEGLTLGVDRDADFPVSELAQREHGLRIFFHGDTYGEKGNITIPCVDIASLTVIANTDLVDLADAGVMAALVGQLETYGVISANGNEDTITVDRAVIVGRNS